MESEEHAVEDAKKASSGPQPPKRTGTAATASSAIEVSPSKKPRAEDIRMEEDHQEPEAGPIVVNLDYRKIIT